MPFRFAYAFVVALSLLWLPTGSARAQQVDRIAAVVNDEIISMQDLEVRLKLAVVMSNLTDSLDVRRRVLPQVLRKMIDERLQMQEANRLKIALTPTEIDTGIATIEQQNRMAKGTMLKQLEAAGVDPEAVREQLKADLTWLKLGSRVLQPTIRIGDEEIADRLEAITARQGRPEYLVAEIVLAVESPRQDEEARKLGERLLEQLRAGAPFPALARQFSQSPTAANGGSMGWVSDGVLEEDLNAVLAGLQTGQVSPLVRSTQGYHILALGGRRIAGSTGTGDPVVTLAQVVFPVPTGRGAPPRQVLSARAAEMTAPLKSCEEIEATGRRIQAPIVGQLAPTRLSEQPQHIRRALANLPPLKASAPMEVDEGILVVMVCKREEAMQLRTPSREAIRRQIEDERMDMLTRRYLRDLRRAAYIDIRM